MWGRPTHKEAWRKNMQQERGRTTTPLQVMKTQVKNSSTRRDCTIVRCCMSSPLLIAIGDICGAHFFWGKNTLCVSVLYEIFWRTARRQDVLCFCDNHDFGSQKKRISKTMGFNTKSWSSDRTPPYLTGTEQLPNTSWKGIWIIQTNLKIFQDLIENTGPCRIVGGEHPQLVSPRFTWMRFII